MSSLTRQVAKSLFAAIIIAFCFASARPARSQNPSPSFTAHEWGTFTSVAGNDGHALEWATYNGTRDLPAFVEHLRDQNFKGGLRGTVRMETPVLYFYTPRKLTLSVKVRFSQGLITEWFPSASHVTPETAPANVTLMETHGDGTISWDAVTAEPSSPAAFPVEKDASQYYAARQTSATPLLVSTSKGAQHEKFLFYRGVSAVRIPLSAAVQADGSVQLTNLGMGRIPSVILFERRGNKVGYRVQDAPSEKTLLDPPQLNSTREALLGDLEAILVRQGLYKDEAHAMVETWRTTWFEEGSRLLYIVPREFVDSILPLSINPAPKDLVRVFVGRIELVTPTTKREVAAALIGHNYKMLQQYQRFLEPITTAICSDRANVAQLPQVCR